MACLLGIQSNYCPQVRKKTWKIIVLGLWSLKTVSLRPHPLPQDNNFDVTLIKHIIIVYYFHQGVQSFKQWLKHKWILSLFFSTSPLYSGTQERSTSFINLSNAFCSRESYFFNTAPGSPAWKFPEKSNFYNQKSRNDLPKTYFKFQIKTNGYRQGYNMVGNSYLGGQLTVSKDTCFS